MEAPLEALFNSLKCFQCKKYLSILPVKVYPDKSVKCGRCSSGTDAVTSDSKIYETVVKNLKFPCINLYEGCSKLLIPAEMKIHEEICIKSKVTCPICEDEQFTDCSLLMIEHFKVKHPEKFLNFPSLMLNLSNGVEGSIFVLKRDPERISLSYYLYVNPSLVQMMAKIIKIRYNLDATSLNIDLADIGKDFQPGNFELINVENKTIHKTCNGYSQIDLKEFPASVAMCKILFESSDNNNKNVIIVSKNLIKVPAVAVDPVYQAVTRSSDKTLNIELEFPNIFLLTNEWLKTDLLLAGTSWIFGIQRKLDKDDFLNLNCCLQKKDDPIQNKYSYQLNGTIGIRAIEFSTDQDLKIEKAVTSIIFGKRPQESMGFSLTDVMRWRNGFNPEIADLLKPKNSIKISLNLKLTGIYIHEKLCKCRGCFTPLPTSHKI